MKQLPAFERHDALLYVFAIAASILLSSWIGHRETVINTDAICYLLSAQIMAESGIKGAMQLCGQAHWPFYSALIYGFVRLSHLTYTSAALVLNGFFSLISVTAFIFIVKALGGSRRVMWFAAFVILLAHEFNSVREYIVRDHGFWAFYLASIWLLIHCFRQPQWKRALTFSMSLLVATLFRIEGAVFLVLLPFLAFFCVHLSLRARVRLFFMLNVPLLAICFLLSAWLLLHPQQSLDQLGRVAEVPAQFRHGLTMIIEKFDTSRISLAQYVLPGDALKDAGLILCLALGAWYVISVVGNLSWGYALLVAYAWLRKSTRFDRSALIVLAGYVGINIMVTLGFLLEHFFLTKRYLMAFSLVLMLWVPFALDDLFQKWPHLRSRFVLLLAGVLMLVSSIGGIIDFGYSKNYIHEAGSWLAKNVPQEARLYANDNLLMYYSQHFGYSIFKNMRQYSDLNMIADDKWKQYDYVALRLAKKQEKQVAPFVQAIHLKPVQVFSNERGDRVVIYKINS
ncbi:hypothetical protein [Aquicella lusitana]|uniref:Dolichyl-phosphate-mannose-protein mannosyltransferase n=1 Tax=Aquicella lusitana TaxID=254246 RepID=A0A370GWT2_9COXI|nr:hypothetical protein [Aquicella lusitana]RDI48112.1 hypothetical protein C8D86_10377 [Aquicella lusitana]VVC72872.1 hypothetical protein AQULUS_05960 [Aquicella lusitana]